MFRKIGRFISFYIPALFWAGIIFYLSSRSDLRLEVGNIPVEMAMRKVAHFLEFSILAFLIFRIFFKFHNSSLGKSVAWSLLIAILYAFSDELHQIFVPGREGKFLDWVFDVVSAFLFLQILVIYYARKNKLIKIIILLATLVVLAGVGYEIIKQAENISPIGSVQKEEKSAGVISQIGKSILPQANSNSSPANGNLPAKVLIKVPFTSQAPFANWDAYHEEACEEAAIVMVKYYLDKKPLSKEDADREIMALIDFEIKNYGSYIDSDAQQMVDMSERFYNITNMKVVYDFQKEDIKKYLALGKPIIAPAAGRLLGNPNFTYPGPLYHALVLTGYDGDWIITNDSGTRKGQDYRYKLDILYNAIHDFPGDKNKIEEGRKAMIVLE